MPKLKTHSGAKKRFRLTATGKVRAKRAMGRHILTKKSRSNKRKKKNLTVMAKCDAAFVKKMIQR